GAATGRGFGAWLDARDPARHHAGDLHRVAADLDPVAGLELTHLFERHAAAQRDGSPHHFEPTVFIHRSRDRAFERVQHGDPAGFEAALRHSGLDRHHLADRQTACGGRQAVFADRHRLVVMHFEAVHADRGKAGDRADDAGAADAALAAYFVGASGAADAAVRRVPGAPDAT